MPLAVVTVVSARLAVALGELQRAVGPAAGVGRVVLRCGQHHVVLAAGRGDGPIVVGRAAPRRMHGGGRGAKGLGKLGGGQARAADRVAEIDAGHGTVVGHVAGDPIDVGGQGIDDGSGGAADRRGAVDRLALRGHRQASTGCRWRW